VLAWIATGAQDYARAAHLMGCAEALSRIALSPVEALPEMHRFHEDCIRRIRQALGIKRYEAEFQAGRQQTFAGAVAYAVGDHPEPATAVETSADTPLSAREWQVAELIADGLKNREIAARLTISPRTADGHVERILAKLRFRTRAQVAAWVAAAAPHHCTAGKEPLSRR
jgi:DNA-binding NarL/FixJ family response regulator